MPPTLPTTSACYSLLTDARLPASVLEHALRVNQVAVFLAEELSTVGKSVPVEAIDVATLLHVLPPRSLPRIPEIASLVRAMQHGRALDPALLPRTLAGRIVAYAEHRVHGASVIPFSLPSHAATRARLVRFEQSLFAPLGLAPLDLGQLEGYRMNHNPRHLLPAHP